MKTSYDAKLTKIVSKGQEYYDLAIENGDFAITTDIDTLIKVALLEKRKSNDKIFKDFPYNKVGGNFIEKTNTYASDVRGSLLWTKKITIQDINFINADIRKSLQFLITLGYCNTIIVNSKVDTFNRKIICNITLLTNDNSKQFIEEIIL